MRLTAGRASEPGAIGCDSKPFRWRAYPRRQAPSAFANFETINHVQSAGCGTASVTGVGWSQAGHELYGVSIELARPRARRDFSCSLQINLRHCIFPSLLPVTNNVLLFIGTSQGCSRIPL